MRINKSVISILLFLAGLMALTACSPAADPVPDPGNVSLTGVVSISAKSNQ